MQEVCTTPLSGLRAGNVVAKVSILSISIFRSETRERQTRSLEDILSAVPPTVVTRRFEGHVSLRPKERLYIAATLASSVLQLHGSWLKSQWRTCDILFPKDESLSRAL